jgi:hypothetical protein
MPESRDRSRIPTVATLALAAVVALVSGAAHLWAEKRASGTEHWQGKEIDYELSGEASSDIEFSKSGRECRITMVIDGRERTLTLKDEDIVVDGEHLDVGSYARLSLNAERDFLIMNLVVTRSWSSSSSGSASSHATSGTNTTTSEKKSRSRSSGKSTDYLAFGFTDLNDMRIRFRLKGGRSVDSSITTGPEERVISFEIDEGKNQGTIAVKPGQLSIDGVRKTVDSDAQILVTATKSSLEITADRTEVWSRD